MLCVLGGAHPSAAQNVAPHVLNVQDVARYREIFSAEREGHFARAKKLFTQVDDKSLQGYVEAEHYLSPHVPHLTIGELVDWLKAYNDLPIADRIYRLAVAHSTRKIRRHHRTIIVAVVTNIPAPSSAHSRGGGYEDLPPPEAPLSTDSARAALLPISAAIRAGQPDQALSILQGLQAAGTATAGDIAHLSHHVAASYLAESMDRKAFDLASATPMADVPQLEWDAGFAAYRLGRYADAATQLERLAQTETMPSGLRSQAAFWAARAHMRMGDPLKVVTLLSFAAREEPSFYGLISERLLGIDSNSGFSDPVLTAQDFSALMAIPSAHRAVALWQIGGAETDIGSELNRAFGDEDPRYDPAMAALSRSLGVTNIELRASEKCAGRGIMLTGLFPVPQYRPEGGYRIDPSLLLAFARIESRFQAQATSPAGARGIMQLMPGTAANIGGPQAVAQLYDPAYSLSLGQRYIEELLTRLDGNLLELGGAYNAGPLAVDRWLATKAGKDDPLLFVESIPVAETRSYVKRLMEYHWMYRRIMGQEAASLRQIAQGSWPLYKPAPTPTPRAPAAAPAAPENPPTANTPVSIINANAE